MTCCRWKVARAVARPAARSCVETFERCAGQLASRSRHAKQIAHRLLEGGQGRLAADACSEGRSRRRVEADVSRALMRHCWIGSQA